MSFPHYEEIPKEFPSVKKKVVLNCKCGGFSLSSRAIIRFAELKGLNIYEVFIDKNPYYAFVPKEEFEALAEEDREFFNDDLIEENREDEDLIKVVEELKEKANTLFSQLEIVEFDLPDDMYYEIKEIDGFERIVKYAKKDEE